MSHERLIISEWLFDTAIGYATCRCCGYVLDDPGPDGHEVWTLLLHQLDCEEGRDIRRVHAEAKGTR